MFRIMTEVDASMGNETHSSQKEVTSHGVWQGESPLDYALPLVLLQICLVVVVTRGIAWLLRPLHQPRVIAEIVGGVLLGPSALGRSSAFLENVFPERGMTVLDTLANIGLLFFLFLVGLELDLRAIRHTGKKALLIAVAGISLPFALGIGTSFALRATVAGSPSHAPFLVFMGVALSITAFPVLARILAELKLLTTDLGRIAMSAAAVNDVAAWVLLALAVALSGDDSSPLSTLWVLLSGAAFIAAAAFVVRPALAWMARRSPEGEPVRELYICATLVAVLAAGFVTDAIGIHALFGAFVVGVIVPKDGPFVGALIEKVEDLVSSLFLPLYFVSSGLKTNVATISGARSWGLLLLVIFTACFGKVCGTVTVSLLTRIPMKEAIALGFLMNTKGLVELIVLNIGRDRKVLNEETFAILVLMALLTTFVTTPVVMAVYKPARRVAPYKHRTVERRGTEGEAAELRVVACFHSSRSIPTLINLVESSRGTGRRVGVVVYAMHLMEYSERSSAISMVHRARRNGLPFWNRKLLGGFGGGGGGGGYDVEVAFKAYEQLSSVSVRPMTEISDLDTMHEDIVASAQRKRAALVVLPFHKYQRVDGIMESFEKDYQQVNLRVLRHAPCSVAILVDRGLGGPAQVPSGEVSHTVAAVFFGGRDDREALSYAARMAEHPGIALVVLRFKTSKPTATDDENSVTVDMEDREDEEFLKELRAKDVAKRYEEREVGSREGMVAAIRSLGRCSLFLVGRTPGSSAAAKVVEGEVGDTPELGPVGTYLASSEFPGTASVLVLQQYNPEGVVDDGSGPICEEEGEGGDAEIYDVPDTPTRTEDSVSRHSP